MTDTRLWGARFRSPPDPALMTLSRGGLDHFRLTRFDIVSSQAHARQLRLAGLLTESGMQRHRHQARRTRCRHRQVAPCGPLQATKTCIPSWSACW